MLRRISVRKIAGLALGLFFAAAVVPVPTVAAATPAADALVAEMRHSFTLDGKPIPPEIFRDFGDGDLADSGAIWVTVDAKAAIGSNLYFDDTKRDGAWVSQKKTGGQEEAGYSFYGATDNGLLVVLTTYSGGGTGVFTSLHILDVASARGFDLDGKVYDRIDLTNLRTIPLGDRWGGEIGIAKNTITIVTTRKGPADDSGKRETTTVEAVRP